MKTRAKITAVGVVICLLFTLRALAIEGLHLSLECSNVVLTWPSVEGEIYIVQYRPTLNPSDHWQTLASALPADAGLTNTTFVHSNVVLMPNCSGDGGSFAAISFGGSGSSLMAAASEDDTPTEPVAIPTNGIGAAVPLQVFPPGFDLSGYYIFDPGSEKVISGKLLLSSLSAGMQLNSFDPPAEDGAVFTNQSGFVSETGFYQVVREGVHIYGMTNDTNVAGSFLVNVEAGHFEGVLQSATLNANGVPIDSVSPDGGLNLRFGFLVDTRKLQNGYNYLQASATWRLQKSNSVESPFYTVSGSGVSVIVSNPVSYPDWVSIVENGAAIRFFSEEPSANWAVDVYGQNNDLIRTFAGQTADGQISVDWNLQDQNGNTRTDAVFHAVARVSSDGVTTNTVSGPILIRIVDNYPDQGKWVVARLEMFPSYFANYSLWVNSLNAIAQMGENGGGVIPPVGTNRNWGEAYQVFSTPTNSNWSDLFFFFTNRTVRNFYYFGHGSPDSIGDRNGGINQAAFAGILNNLLVDTNTTILTNATRYRFVWLDGCQTANGSLPGAFGIGKRQNVPLDGFRSRPAAYCGFLQDTHVYSATIPPDGGTPLFGSVHQDAAYYRANFAFYWKEIGESLSSAFEDARRDSGYNESYNLIIYGYSDLHWNEFNTKAAWPPP